MRLWVRHRSLHPPPPALCPRPGLGARTWAGAVAATTQGCVARCGMRSRMRDARQDAGVSAGGALPPSRRQGNRPPSPPTRGGPPQPPLDAGGTRPSLPRCWTAASPPPQRAGDGGGRERTSLGHGRSKRNAANLKEKGEGYVGCFVLDWQVESINQKLAFMYICIYLFIWESLFTWHR